MNSSSYVLYFLYERGQSDVLVSISSSFNHTCIAWNRLGRRDFDFMNGQDLEKWNYLLRKQMIDIQSSHNYLKLQLLCSVMAIYSHFCGSACCINTALQTKKEWGQGGKNEFIEMGRLSSLDVWNSFYDRTMDRF